MGLGLPDCPLFAGMYEYAALAAGATLKGADLILAGEAGVVFNPSGGYHHAGPAMAAGFCYVNDVALACLKLADAGRRVLFLDIDVHHGDGVQDAFYRRPDVMTVSFHESGATLYPGTGFEDEIGEDRGRGYSVNLPLPVGTYDEAYLRAFDQVVPPLTGAFRPDAIVIQIGMDGLAGDPLAHMNLTNNVFVDVVGRLLETDIPLLATGGGGYHPENTARGWALCWAALTGEAPDEDLAIGLGGVMLESADWLGGLRDRPSLLHGGQRKAVDEAIDRSVRIIHETIFPLHGLVPSGG
jgi:acetoin utilization protein AcuC